MLKGSKRSRLIVGLAAVAVLAAACSSSGSSAAPSAAAPSAAAPSAAAPSAAAPSGSAAAKQYKIGYSNAGGVGNGFREEQLCTAKAEALASGQVASEITGPASKTRRGRAAPGHPRPDREGRRTRSSSTRTTRTALNPALAEAQAAGIKTVVGGRLRHRPEHAGTSTTTRSSTPSSAPRGCSRSSAARATSTTCAASPATRPTPTATPGFKKALKEYPGIKVVPSTEGVATGWDPRHGHQAHQRLHRQRQVRHRSTGIWTSGHRLAGRRRHQGGRQEVRADRRRRPAALRQAAARPDGGYPGLEGLAVTNTAAVGGAGVNLALQAAQRRDAVTGQTVRTRRATTSRSAVFLPTPDRVRQHDRRGQGEAAGDRRPRPEQPSGRSAGHIDGWTDYTIDQMLPPARARANRPQSDSQRRAGGCRFAGIPPARSSDRNEADDPHRHRPPARGDRRLEDVRRRRRAEVGVAGGPARRGPRADGRQRRRQEHVRQDPDGRRPPGCRTIAVRGRERTAHSPARGASRRARLGLPGAGAHPGPRHPVEPAPDRYPRRTVPPLAPRAGLERLDLSRWRGACRWPRSASSTSPAPSPSSPTC